MISSAIILGLIFSSIVLILLFKSPFDYPYFYREFDVTGKRNPQFEDCIDEYLNEGFYYEIEQHEEAIATWKQGCAQLIEQSWISKYRQRQFYSCLDEDHTYRFALTRTIICYKQVDNMRIPIESKHTVQEYTCNFWFLREREGCLSRIGHQTTLNNYNTINQRKLMTPQLRKEIMIRDSYTCQICGKYMPDEVGLQIDHIVPVSRGGKTIPSNLQVLCSKCNARKSNN